MISTASRVHMGPRGPTCHVRHTYLTPNVIRFLSVRTHARRILDKTYRNVNMFVYRINCRHFGGSRAPCPPFPPSPPVGFHAFSILGHARPNGIRVLEGEILPGHPTSRSHNTPFGPSRRLLPVPVRVNVTSYPDAWRACVACVVCTRAAGRVLVIVCMCVHGTMCLASSFELIN